MAFGGVANIKKISDRKFRITGLLLDPQQTGTIGLSQNATADVRLEAPGWDRYDSSGLQGGLVELDESIEFSVFPPLDSVILTAKSGNGPTDFEMSFTNTLPIPGPEDPPGIFSFDEIYVEFH